MTTTTTDLQLVGTNAAGQRVTLTGTLTQADLVPPRRTAFGSDATPINMARTPGCEYTRVYGPNGLNAKAVLAAQAAGVRLVHASYKGQTIPAAVNGLLDQLTKPIALEPLHEMNRSVANGGPTPAAYLADYAVLHKTVRAHRNSHLVLLAQTWMRWAEAHNGATRGWQDFAAPDMADLMGWDVEWDAAMVPADKGYPRPADLAEIPLAAAKVYGKPLLYPEWAWPQLTDDPGGYGLAGFMTQSAAGARAAEVYAMAAYDSTGSTSPTGTYVLGPRPLAAWCDVMATQ